MNEVIITKLRLGEAITEVVQPNAHRRKTVKDGKKQQQNVRKTTTTTEKSTKSSLVSGRKANGSRWGKSNHASLWNSIYINSIKTQK